MFKLIKEQEDRLSFTSGMLINRIFAHELQKAVFYDGKINSFAELLQLFKNSDVAFSYQDGVLCGALWIQREEHRVGRIHFVTFSPFNGEEALPIIEKYLQKKLDRSNNACYTIIIGITPYRAVARYFRKIGFSDAVKMPDYHYDNYKQCYIPCWHTFLTPN